MPATHLPSNYTGIYNDKSTKTINIQNQEKSQNAGEGSNRKLKVVVDYDGHAIDLNQPYSDHVENKSN